MNYVFWTAVVVLCLVLVVGVLLIFRGRQIITIVRDAWERGQLRTPDGQFKMIPTLAEARKFAGARGEPLITCKPVYLDPDAGDALDVPVDVATLARNETPGIADRRDRWGFSRWRR